MTQQIILVIGELAEACACALASTDGIAISAIALGRHWNFQPIMPVYLFASENAELWHLRKKAAAVIAANRQGHADAIYGRFNGIKRGSRIRWGAPR